MVTRQQNLRLAIFRCFIKWLQKKSTVSNGSASPYRHVLLDMACLLSPQMLVSTIRVMWWFVLYILLSWRRARGHTVSFVEIAGYIWAIKESQNLKGGYTLVTLTRIVTPYRDSVDGTRDRVTYQSLLHGNVTGLGVLSIFGHRMKGLIRLRSEQVWTCNLTLHVHTCSGRNRIIPFMRWPNIYSTPNKPVTLPCNKLWYVTRSRVPSTLSRYGVTIRGNVTSVYPH